MTINPWDRGALCAEAWERQTGLEIGGAAQVVVALLDGRRIQGRLPKFSPQMPDIVIEPDPEQREKLRSPRLRAEEIAYVGFVRGTDAMPPIPSHYERWRVRVAGGEEVLVHAAPQSVSNALGFLARPAEERFRAVYFYRHGVSARERDAPLGAMLVSAGVLGKSALDHGVAKQSEARNVPIGQILIEQRKLDKETVDEAAELQKRKRMRLGEVLQEAGLVSAADIDAALAEQKKRKGKRLGEMLVELGYLQERDLAMTLAVKFDLPFVNLDEVAINPEAGQLAGR
ncbi:MAG TPA: hypothetical protein VFZ61_20905, partial [Polyangiales bacterium]